MIEESLHFHIQSDDYFGTLATILDLLRQDARRGYRPDHDRLLLRLRDDLTDLQRHFRIVKVE
jgi:hypothetical protein